MALISRNKINCFRILPAGILDHTSKLLPDTSGCFQILPGSNFNIWQKLFSIWGRSITRFEKVILGAVKPSLSKSRECEKFPSECFSTTSNFTNFPNQFSEIINFPHMFCRFPRFAYWILQDFRNLFAISQNSGFFWDFLVFFLDSPAFLGSINKFSFSNLTW